MRDGSVVLCPVSIHAPNEGSDEMYVAKVMINLVSIHAPNEGSDPIFLPGNIFAA